MMRIDAHQHFWHFDRVRDSWITDEMSVIQRDFLPADLQPVLSQNGMDGCIAVQADQSEAQNDFLLGLAQGNTFIKGIVGWVDLRAENVIDRLQFYQQFPVIKGFRHVLQGEEDRALMLTKEFMRGVQALGQFNYTYDILIFPDQLKYVPEFVSAFPGQKFVIDHLAKPYIKAKQVDEWKRDMAEAGKFENTYCKLSGMVTEANWQNWTTDDFYPYLDVVVEAFGPDRIMFGSDWPVCLVAASYERMMGIVKDYFASFPTENQEKVFGGNATQFYNLI